MMRAMDNFIKIKWIGGPKCGDEYEANAEEIRDYIQRAYLFIEVYDPESGAAVKVNGYYWFKKVTICLYEYRWVYRKSSKAMMRSARVQRIFV